MRVSSMTALPVLMLAALGAVWPARSAFAAPAADRPVTIFAFGDSLTAGYGVAASEAFPSRLETALRARGLNVTVVNGGVSGDTSADGLSRLDWSLPPEADAAIVEFGANDAFRGVPPATMKSNLDQIVARLTDKGLPLVVAGMKAPRNLGNDYAAAFDAAFAEIATRHGAILYPFFLDGVILDPALNQRDGIHPNPRGVDIIVARMTPTIEALVARTLERRKSGSASKP